jgi:hypothetical protein
MRKSFSRLTDDHIPLALFLALAFGLACTPIWSWDIWWHLKTGQLILERGAIPHVDWFSYGSSEEAWIDLHWGFQVLTALLFQLGGINLLVLAKATLFAVVVAIGWKTSGGGLPVWLKVSIWILTALCLDSRVTMRPELLSFLFLATWLYVLHVSISKNPRSIWLLPLIQLFWVNSHGLFILGLVVYGAFLISLIAEFFFPILDRHPRFNTKTLLVLSASIIAASFCNPYFAKGATFPFVLYRKFSTDSDFYSLVVGEFLPLIDCVKQYGLFDLPLLSEIILFVITALSFILLWSSKKINIFRIVLFIAFSHLAWIAWRNVGVFAIITASISCWNFSDWIELRGIKKSKGRSAAKGGGGKSYLPEHIPTAILGLLCLLVYTGNSSFFSFSQKNIGLGERQDRFIHAASQFAGQEGFPKRAFMPWHHAGVYIYHNAPEYKVFMDGRLEVNTRESFERHNYALYRMSLGDPNWVGPVLDENGQLPVVILDKTDSRREILGLMQISGWIPVYSDSVAVVFVPGGIAIKLRLPAIPPQLVLQ